MWWCCLKKGIRAPGCKSQKHESKDDDDDMDEDGADGLNKSKVKKNARCFCCKELGHEIMDCPQDPNFKTAKVDEMTEELKRIMNIKDKRKLFADTQIVTTHFLKKCIAVPKLDNAEEELNPLSDKSHIQTAAGKLTIDDILQMQEYSRRNLFKRGGMTLEDYNYSNYNRYVLIDPENPGAGETTDEASQDPDNFDERKSKVTLDLPTAGQDDKIVMTEAILDQSVKDDYMFNEFDIATNDEKERARHEKIK